MDSGDFLIWSQCGYVRTTQWMHHINVG